MPARRFRARAGRGPVPFKDLNQLLEYYYGSVGRNCNMLMNVAPDQQGLLDQPTVAALSQFNTALPQTFGTDLAGGATAANDSGTTNTAGHTSGLAVTATSTVPGSRPAPPARSCSPCRRRRPSTSSRCRRT